MSAYHLRDLWNECDENSCRSQKKVSLYNWQNSHMGDYCRKHGTESPISTSFRGFKRGGSRD